MTDHDTKSKLEAALSAARATVQILEAELASSPTAQAADDDLVPLRKCGVPVRTARQSS
jgi:hypothetical protein